MPTASPTIAPTVTPIMIGSENETIIYIYIYIVSIFAQLLHGLTAHVVNYIKVLHTMYYIF